MRGGLANVASGRDTIKRYQLELASSCARSKSRTLIEQDSCACKDLAKCWMHSTVPVPLSALDQVRFGRITGGERRQWQLGCHPGNPPQA